MDPRYCDWYCDNCNEYMNDQPGFTTDTGEWVCANCGYCNDVTEDNIIYDDDFEEEEEETYSVEDAALAWLCSGKDEDYMFGYTEEELEDAL